MLAIIVHTETAKAILHIDITQLVMIIGCYKSLKNPWIHGSVSFECSSQRQWHLKGKQLTQLVLYRLSIINIVTDIRHILN